MKKRKHFDLPADIKKKLRHAVILEWITIAAMLSIIIVLFLAMGESQALKMAWLEDILALIPSIAFLIAIRGHCSPPDKMFPYGRNRALLISFLVASVAILIFGSYMLYNSVQGLVTQQRPTIGQLVMFGRQWPFWSGWVMIGALTYSMILPMILGHIKVKIAKELHEKTLYADAIMEKADWQTALAGIVGILGVGMGFWWADSLAAAFISVNVLFDGFINVKRSMYDLMDRRPTRVGSDEPLYLEEKIKAKMLEDPDVKQVHVRLREEGITINGEAFVILKDTVEGRKARQLSEDAVALDWRLHEVNVVITDKFDKEEELC